MSVREKSRVSLWFDHGPATPSKSLETRCESMKQYRAKPFPDIESKQEKKTLNQEKKT